MERSVDTSREAANLLGLIDTMDVAELDCFAFGGFELGFCGASLHETRVFKENGQDYEEN